MEESNLPDEQIELVTDVVETVVHELVHMQEGSDCKSTHDATFRNELANYLERLFIWQEAEESVLEMLGL